MDLRDCCEKSPAQPRSAVRGKALVVDECPEDLKYCSTLLESYGYQVRGCCSYCEGVKCLDDQGFDFVIVSQGTPKFSGSSVPKRVIELDRNLSILEGPSQLSLGPFGVCLLSNPSVLARSSSGVPLRS